jgi:hypothetical protein
MKKAIAAVVLAAALTIAGPAAAGKKQTGGTVTTTYSCTGGVFSWSYIVTTLSGIFTGGSTSSADC